MPAYREGPTRRAPVKRARKKKPTGSGIAAAVESAVQTGTKVASHARGPKPHPGRTVFNTPVGKEFNRKGVPHSIQHERRKVTHAGQKAAAKTQAPIVGNAPLFTRNYLRAHPKARAQLGKQLEQAAARAQKQGIEPGWATLNYLKGTNRPGALQPYRRSQTVGRQEQQQAQVKLSGAKTPDYTDPHRDRGIKKAAVQAAGFFGNGDPNTSKFAPAVVFNNSTPIGWAGRDALEIASSPVTGTVQSVKAGIAATHGDFGPAKEQLTGWVKTDPFVNTGKAAVLAAQGKPKEARHKLTQAGDYALHHPVSTYLEFEGGKAAVGRSIGLVGRSGALGKTIKKAASTGRTPKVLEGTSLEQQQTYSRDVIRKAGQVRRERKSARKVISADRRAQKLDDAGKHEEAKAVRTKAADHQPGRMSDQDVRRRVDERVAANEDLRRLHRSQIVDTVHQTRISGRKGGDVVALVAQRIVKPSREDLQAYAHELEGQYKDGDLSRAQKAANRKLRSSIGRAVDRKSLDFEAVAKAADEYVAAVRPSQDALVESGMLSGAQAEKARLIPYAVRHMDARHDGEQIVGPDGNPLTTAEIRAHMEANNVGEPAFITQRPNSRGARNFFRDWTQGAAIGKAARTGEATRKGTFDTDRDVLVEQAAHAQGLVDANEGFKGFVGEFGLRSKRGRVKTFQTRGQADRAAEELRLDEHGNGIPGARSFRPVRVRPFGGTETQFAKLLEDTHNHDYETGTASPVQDAIENALKGTGEGPYALVPDVAADRLLQHTRLLGAGSGGKVFQLLSSTFRKTVLATSVKWLTGNAVEAGLRSVIDHAGPRSWYVGRQTLKKLNELDPKAAEEARVRAVGGGHFSLSGRQSMHRGAEQFKNSGPALRNTARALGAFWRAPGPKHMAKTWGAWTHLVFEGNSMLERHFQTAMAGKWIRQNLMPGHAIKVSQQAIDDAAKGLKGTSAQVAMGRAVDRAYGKYSKFTPGQRHAISTYTPFAAWALSAARFVFDVLPRDHPVLTALLVAQNEATAEWRKDKGLDPFLAGAVPDFLQGSVPTGKGWVRATRYTPFGAFTDPGGTAADLLLPQLSGVVLALKGRDWKGDKLNGEHGPAATPDEKFAAAFQAFLEGTVPALAQAHRVATNPDGPVAGIVKEVNPFQPVVSKPKKKTGTSSGGGGGWGGGSSSSGSSSGGKDYQKTGGW